MILQNVMKQKLSAMIPKTQTDRGFETENLR